MIRIYLVDKEANELANCIRARICTLSAELNDIKTIEQRDELVERINTLDKILDIVTERY